jgi:hypothetical protein
MTHQAPHGSATMIVYYTVYIADMNSIGPEPGKTDLDYRRAQYNHNNLIAWTEVPRVHVVKLNEVWPIG